MNRTPNLKRTRKISEPCRDTQAREDVQPVHLTVQGLSHNRKNSLFATLKSLATPSTVPTPPSPVPEEPTPDDDYMRYLGNLSTVTINRGREFRNVPAYLRQFEMSRRGTMSTSERPTVRRRISTAHDPSPSILAPPPVPQKPQNKVKSVLVAVLSKHRAVGLRHFILALLLALYAIGGMFLFHAIEAPYERKNVAETRDSLNEAFQILAADLEVTSTIPNANMSLLLKKAYLTLIKIDGKYTGSTFYKLEERDYPMWTWSYGTAFFFSFTLYSTVGYGSISPSTEWGRVAVIFYTAIGFPCALVIIRDIGSVLLVYLTRIYAKVVIKMRTAGGYSSGVNEGIMLPKKVAIILSFVYALITAVFVMNYDAWLGPEPGLDLFHSFYFTFLSFAAVGLGDIMPVNYAHAPLVAIVLLCGMPLMRVVNRVLYVGIENTMYGSVAFVEESIDKIAPEESIEKDRLPTIAEDVENGENLSPLEEYTSEGEDDEVDQRIRNELMNNFTLRSATGLANPNHA